MTSRFKLMTSEAFRSLGSNLSTTIAATMTVLIGMFLLGLLIALGTWVVSWSDHVKEQLEVKAFFTEDATPKQVNAVRVHLAKGVAAGEIKQFHYVSKAEALKIQQKRTPDLVKNLPFNSLPASYVATPVDATRVKELSRNLRRTFNAGVCRSGGGNPTAPSGVECVRDGEQTSKRILEVSRVIEAIFLAAVIVLLIASVVLIANTIRLSIFSRRREIEVMKLVGATNWFVRGPFMVEGLLCGAVGAAAAIIFLVLGKQLALERISSDFTSTPDVSSMPFLHIGLILVGMGLAVGAIGSGVTMRRYLRV
ncbi:MAG: cell division protein FtsX [Gaiella sp.]